MYINSMFIQPNHIAIFVFPEIVPVSEHLEKTIGLYSVCTPMYLLVLKLNLNTK